MTVSPMNVHVDLTVLCKFSKIFILIPLIRIFKNIFMEVNRQFSFQYKNFNIFFPVIVHFSEKTVIHNIKKEFKSEIDTNL